MISDALHHQLTKFNGIQGFYMLSQLMYTIASMQLQPGLNPYGEYSLTTQIYNCHPHLQLKQRNAHFRVVNDGFSMLHPGIQDSKFLLKHPTSSILMVGSSYSTPDSFMSVLEVFKIFLSCCLSLQMTGWYFQKLHLDPTISISLQWKIIGQIVKITSK